MDCRSTMRPAVAALLLVTFAGTSFAQNEILQRPCTSKDNCFAQWGYITSQIKFQEELSPELNCRCNHGDISKCPKSLKRDFRFPMRVAFVLATLVFVVGLSSTNAEDVYFFPNNILQRPCTSKDNCYAQGGFVSGDIRTAETSTTNPGWPGINCRCNHGDPSRCPHSVCCMEKDGAGCVNTDDCCGSAHCTFYGKCVT
ncbi:hypothetical protein CVIRNUC_003672 [Coccomyxa viridis]|uniref:Extracellular protein n=1 Tax=Coccomyxa viridis TaxID=1274662 RepID=A0AAV1I0G5_9CHLO|nr:hypothetical protein CVIRNUC_003672 [Coccomyxa viridis]